MENRKANGESLRKLKKANERTKEELAKLDVMEYLRKCSGKEFDEPATLADWEDTSNRHQEIRDMMRFCGLEPWKEITLADVPKPPPEVVPKEKVLVMGSGSRKFPFIVDPEYFKPHKTRPAKYYERVSSIYFSF